MVLVLVLHCPEDSMYDWSLVVRYEPFRTPVLVCLDDMGEHCMGIYADSPQARQALSDLHVRLIGGFANRQHAKDTGLLPRTPRACLADLGGGSLFLVWRGLI
ncbi:hypothetical protein [Micromonospora craniellae]|uniref:Uncharacterized protein n=1 Tax=Micromonospora craniellae TaxID=2294034 RepID=A0A372G5M4_9ACTN|nr:hypothetical protein [Micromonospora craniellae]QOC90316.1 hypothetical protein ID554_19260 [Micromonospora craniellae]RFS48293.1 hypothetical protein D0Q02_02080 [Micromonospora craniellae]